jgi:hypothetical protein
MHLQLEVRLTAEDYFEAQRLHLGRRLAVFPAVASIVIALGLVFGLACLGVTDWREWLSAAAGYGIWFFLFRWRFARLLERRLVKKFQTQGDLQLTYRVTLDDDKIAMGAPGRGEWMVPWTDFYLWRANEKVIVAYMGEKLFRIFPRHWFSHDADFLAVQDLLTKNVGPRNRPRTPSPQTL